MIQETREPAAGRYLAAWQEGVPLWAAVEKYSPEALWNRYVELRNTARPYVPDGPIITPTLADGSSTVSDSPLGQLAELSALEHELTSAIVDLLCGQKLFALGYLKPRLRRNAEPILISAEFWKQGEIDWNNSEFLFEHVTYIEVRVIPSPEFREGDKVDAELQPREPGGPSLKSDMETVYADLKRTNKIDFKKSLRANLPAIQKAVRERVDPARPLAEIRGIKYEAVRMAIGDQFKRDKAANKSR